MNHEAKETATSRSDTLRLNYLEVRWQTVRLRYIPHQSINGKYPAWAVFTGPSGTQTYKTLREALDAAIEIDLLD